MSAYLKSWTNFGKKYPDLSLSWPLAEKGRVFLVKKANFSFSDAVGMVGCLASLLGIPHVEALTNVSRWWIPSRVSFGWRAWFGLPPSRSSYSGCSERGKSAVSSVSWLPSLASSTGVGTLRIAHDPRFPGQFEMLESIAWEGGRRQDWKRLFLHTVICGFGAVHTIYRSKVA